MIHISQLRQFHAFSSYANRRLLNGGQFEGETMGAFNSILINGLQEHWKSWVRAPHFPPLTQKFLEK